MDEAKLAEIGGMMLGDEAPQEEVVEEVTDTPVEGVSEAPDEAVEEQGEAEVEVEASDEPEGPEYVEIEIDGEVLEVDAKYKDYFLRQEDYTTKTQEIAEQRKTVEVQRGEMELRASQFEFAESIRPDVLKAQQLEASAQQYHQYLRDNIDTLSSVDIEKLRLAIEDSNRERDALVQSVQQKQSEFQQASEQSKEELRNKGTEILRQKIPGWGETQQKQVRDYALSSGFTEAEISTVLDPRQVETLWKAAQYDALKAGAAPAVKKVQQAPTIKTKARKSMPKETQDKLNLRKKLKSNISARDKRAIAAEDIGKRWG